MKPAMRLELSGFIEGDLTAIGDYIAADNPRRALSFIREIQEQFGKIGQHPLLYQLRPEIGAGARLLAWGNYVILFQIVGESVRIERVIHGSRNLSALFARESYQGNA
jgi:toxin ParE1/3/4